jgi:SPP1 family predicted phage head-tail adaptor
MQAGELDQRVTFSREVRAPDGSGGSESTWTDFATVWAKCMPISSIEREQAARQSAEATYLFTIRKRTDIDETCVAVWNGRRFNVRFVRDMPRSAWLEIEVEKGVAV